MVDRVEDRVFGEYLFAGELMGGIGEAVISWFFVIEDLLGERNTRELLKESCRYKVLIESLEAIVEVGATGFAESPLSPIR